MTDPTRPGHRAPAPPPAAPSASPPPAQPGPPPASAPGRDAATATATDAALDGELREARGHLSADVEALADEVERELGIDLRAWARPELVERFVDLVSPLATAIRIGGGGAIGAAGWIGFCVWALHGNVGTAGAVIGGGLAVLALPFVTVAIASAAGIHVAAGHIAALTDAGRELAAQGIDDVAAMMTRRDDPPPPSHTARLLLRGTLLVVVLPGAEVGIRRALKFAGRPVAWAVRRVGSMVVRRALPPRLSMKGPTVPMPSGGDGVAETHDELEPTAHPRDEGDASRPPSPVSAEAAIASTTTALTAAFATLGDQLERVGSRAPLTFRRWTWIGAGLLTALSAMGIALVAALF